MCRISPCNTLQHTATHCLTLQHTATHDTATHCALQHTATHCNTLQHIRANGVRQPIAERTRLIPPCNTLQHWNTSGLMAYASRLQDAHVCPKMFIQELLASGEGMSRTKQVLYVCKRALYICKRALHIRKRALHIGYSLQTKALGLG